ncbi:retrovirus-related pol polyprotein from transposon TNT 1-94 [Tanacetum coccineum]|uniref:Retrovirus-related pol polyprotein from transposon TNT 1-94 n=1 Tax=Tanacetum coccineum TaxID=301880 RepID=A0ABQ5GBA7_9ASTR
MIASFFPNEYHLPASSSGSGSFPSNTVANPRGDLKAITTRSGISYDGPPILPLPNVVEWEPEAKDTVNEELYGRFILKKVPEKLGDPDKFLISCDFQELVECLALADLDRLTTSPSGIAEDVFVKVGKFYFSTDFVVVDYVVDPQVPLILERPFFSMAHALIDVYGEELTLRVDDEAITFNVGQTLRYSYNDAVSINRIDVIDVACEEYAQEVLGFLGIVFYELESTSSNKATDAEKHSNDSWNKQNGTLMPLEQFQVNTNILNTLPDEWSKFVTKLNCLVVPVFQKGDDPIDAINHMMSFLTAVVTSRYTHNEQSGKDFRQTHVNKLPSYGNDCATYSGRPKLTYAAGTPKKIHTCASGSNNWETTDVICYNCKWDGHIANKPRESKPKLIVVPDSDETIELSEKSRSKMILKEQDPLFEKHKVNTKPINYAILNNDYYKRFVRQTDLYCEHAYWKATSVPALDPSHSSTTVIVEVPKELPTVSMVNTSLKKLKRHLTGFDQVVKERTTATAITEGTWGFEHTKACFRDEIIPFIKNLKDIFNNFNRYLVEELADVQKVFYQMEQAVEQHRLESRTFEVKMNQVLSENERLLAQAIDKDIVKTVVNLSVNASGETVTECQKCLELETELVKKKDFVDKETYDKLCKCFTTLEKHCITLEADSQLNQEIFQQENSVLNQNAPSFTQLFELSELKAQSQAKDTVIVKLKEQIKSLKGNVEDSSVKMDMDEIETLNIELEHRVTKLVTENEHLKQTYKQLYDSIKPKRVQSKEQCDALIKQVNIKSGEISDLNAKLQEQGLVIAALKNELRKLKGKAIDNKETVTHSVDPNVSKDNMEPITPKLLNKRTAHSSYIKHTQEEALVLRDIVEHVKANYPQDPLLESAFRYTKVIQDLLSHISRSCPSINNCGPQLIEVIPRKKDKQVRFAESLTSKENTKPVSTSNIVSNKRVLHSTGVRLSTSASGSQPSGNTKNDRILQTPSSNSKNKVEAHPRNKSKKQDDSDSVCVNSNDCMSSDNVCVSNAVNVVKSRAKPKKNKPKKDIWKTTGKVFTKIGYIWRPTDRTFTIVGNACPLTRIITTNEVPSRKPIVLESESPKPVVKLVYSRKPRKNKNTESVSKTKVIKPMSANKQEPSKS